MDNFDFVCINLAQRKDRKDMVMEVFKELNILDQINWWIVDKHPAGGMYGCFESHWSVLTCPDFTKKYICVFEDDLILLNPDKFNKTLKWVNQNMPEKADILNLEPNSGFLDKRLSKNIWTGFFFHAGAYIVARSSLKKITRKIRPLFGMDFDTALYANCKMAGVYPQIFQQRGTDSDNGGGYRAILNKIPRIITLKENKKISQSMFGWVKADLAYLASLWLIFGKNQPELVDRRIK